MHTPRGTPGYKMEPDSSINLFRVSRAARVAVADLGALLRNGEPKNSTAREHLRAAHEAATAVLTHLDADFVCDGYVGDKPCLSLRSEAENDR
jgi:hypothetical protein